GPPGLDRAGHELQVPGACDKAGHQDDFRARPPPPSGSLSVRLELTAKWQSDCESRCRRIALQVLAASRDRRQRRRLQMAEPQVSGMVSRCSLAKAMCCRRLRAWAAQPVRLREERARQATLGFLGHALHLQFASTLARRAANWGSSARERALQRRRSRTVLRVYPRARVRHNRVPEQDRFGATRLDRPTRDRWPLVRVVPSGLALVLLPASPHRSRAQQRYSRAGPRP